MASSSACTPWKTLPCLTSEKVLAGEGLHMPIVIIFVIIYYSKGKLVVLLSNAWFLKGFPLQKDPSSLVFISYSKGSMTSSVYKLYPFLYEREFVF